MLVGSRERISWKLFFGWNILSSSRQDLKKVCCTPALGWLVVLHIACSSTACRYCQSIDVVHDTIYSFQSRSSTESLFFSPKTFITDRVAHHRKEFYPISLDLLYTRVCYYVCVDRHIVNLFNWVIAITVLQIFVERRSNPLKNKSFDGQEAVQKGNRGPKGREVKKSRLTHFLSHTKYLFRGDCPLLIGAVL